MNHDDRTGSAPSVPLEQLGMAIPPERWAELQPRLAALLADFDELKSMEREDLEPAPAFTAIPENGDGWD
ncbi:MAG: hypothetical protein U0031_10865 [Thermomicrobiales bacterium]